MEKPKRMGWTRTLILAIGAGVGTMLFTPFLGAVIGVLATAGIIHLLRQ